MSAAVKPRSAAEPRAVLGPGGNRVSVPPETNRKSEGFKKPQWPPVVPPSVVRNNGSVDSSCSSDSSSTRSPLKMGVSARSVKRTGLKPAKAAPRGVDTAVEVPAKASEPQKRCNWITPNSDPLYTCFHDEEWGIQVHDDRKLFELLVFSQALAELSWPTILNKRDIIRKLFDNFDVSSIAQFNEKKLLSLTINGSLLLSEPKLRAIVENAKLMIKIQKEFGSFSNYCWKFVNHMAIRNRFRYARQVPVKTPKAELISKDLMQRGFRCVGPTVIYSFMQVAGIVNDHLVTCFRYQECNGNVKKDLKPKINNTEVLTEALEKTCLSCD